MDARAAGNLRKFLGKNEDWNEWSFSFKRAMKSMGAIVYETMTEAELTGINFDEPFELGTTRTTIKKKASGELYDIL